MLDNILENGDQREIEKFVKSEKIAPGSDGWLSPKGNYYEVKSTEHNEAADWIIMNDLSEIPRRRYETITDLECQKRSDLPSRPFLLKNRWILMNGPIFRTDDALNYTTKQLKLLAEVGIPVVGVFDGAKEFSSQETLEWVEKTAKNISDFIEGQKNIIALVQTFGGWNRQEVDQARFWENMKDRGFSTLEDFKKDPFHTTFGDFGSISFTDIRDVMSQGYQDEMVFDYGMETYTFRLLKLNSGERICVEYTFHHHDRDWGNEEHMNAYVVDDFTFKEKINKFVGSKFEPQIKGEYFRRFIEGKQSLL